MKREPNTVYVLSLSYGKDSLACLDAIQKLGYPLDRIIHAEVWATDTIPADLPPMVEFKKKADEIIKARYGLTVEHICATRKVEGERERERESGLVSRSASTLNTLVETTSEKYGDSLYEQVNGVPLNSKRECLTHSQKETYESYFYHIPKRKDSTKSLYDGKITGFPQVLRPWCNSRLKVKALSLLAFLNAPLHKEQI